MSVPTTTRSRAPRVLAAAIAIGVVAILTLGPGRLIAPARWALLSTIDALSAPIYVVFPQAEPDQVLNTMLFVPLGAALALTLPRRAWWVGILACAGLSAAVEFFQTAIPGRVPDGTDVLWNTVGATIGVGAVVLPRLVLAAVQRVSVTRT